MQIQLYGENDSRPHGTYTKIQKVNINKNGVLLFVRDNGDQIMTTLRFKLVVEKDERIKCEKNNLGVEITPLESTT